MHMHMHMHTGLAADEGAGANALVIGIVVFVGLAMLVVLGVFARFFNLWVQCKFTGVGISMGKLIMMSIRKVNPSMMVRCKIMAVQAGLPDISTTALEAHFLSGGNVPNVIRALVAAHRAGIDMEWQDAQAIDLAGRDVLDAVRTSVNPRVIDCPDSRFPNATLDAVAGDGIQLKARARVTVRTNIKQLIGGATEETIIARVGQGIVRAIGSTSSYKNVLSNPELISQTVLNEGLEAQTSFEIVSIDIADIDVGENIGARLQADRAEADVRIFQAHAEERRAAAAAREQEMVALTQENRAEVVLAEATVPMSIAGAFRSGKLGLMDYYELKNVQADTKMRSTIAGVKDDSMA